MIRFVEHVASISRSARPGFWTENGMSRVESAQLRSEKPAAEVRLSARPKHVRTLIVNGEAAVRAQLHRLCEDRADLDVIAEATSGAQAIDVIQGGDTNLLLLDARLPDMSGFDLLRSLDATPAPATIMVSARHEADPQPSGMNVNFLYKPVDPPQFNAAVDNAIADTVASQGMEAHAASWPPQIIGEKSGRIYFLDAHEVDYVASAGNYVAAHVGAHEFLTRATLKCMSQRLAPLGFVQIERSLLVNLRRVAYVERHERGQFCFVMRGGARLVSSRERGASLRAFLLGATSP
jgi:two-component system LytT family response regulator